jgi:hypothetical protein
VKWFPYYNREVRKMSTLDRREMLDRGDKTLSIRRGTP